jgi:hypothetical protein
LGGQAATRIQRYCSTARKRKQHRISKWRVESVSKCAQRLGWEQSCFHNELSALSPGWGGRDRTSEWRNQNPLPYRLATPQQSGPEHGIDQRDLFRHRRSIEGVTPFQQAEGPNFTPKSAPSIYPYIKGHCFGCAGPVFASPGGRLPPRGELREPRFRGKTAAAISQKARLSS